MLASLVFALGDEGVMLMGLKTVTGSVAVTPGVKAAPHEWEIVSNHRTIFRALLMSTRSRQSHLLQPRPTRRQTCRGHHPFRTCAQVSVGLLRIPAPRLRSHQSFSHRALFYQRRWSRAALCQPRAPLIHKHGHRFRTHNDLAACSVGLLLNVQAIPRRSFPVAALCAPNEHRDEALLDRWPIWDASASSTPTWQDVSLLLAARPVRDSALLR